MTQLLHIFKKDVRRHWPEILISLALLVLFTRRELDLWKTSTDYNDLLSGSYTPFFLVLSWIFLILRIVHSESLVGDRQWWITKPYVWWRLLLSKLFFIFVVIWAPLFGVQLSMLHHAGFSVLPNLIGFFQTQLTLPLILFVFAFALASLTKNLPQALLGVGIAAVVFFGGVWLDSLSGHMTGDFSGLDTLELVLEQLLIFGSITLVPVWQFARRKTWASRTTLAAFLGAATVLSLIPRGGRVEQAYPLVAAKDSPAQFAIPAIPEFQGNPSNLLSFTSDTVLSIPVNVSGVAPGSAVRIDGMKITADSSDDSRWTRGWVSQYQQLWPGGQRQNLGYEVKRKDYERVKAKALNLQIQLALSEVQEGDARTLVLPANIFRDSDLGICRLVTLGYQELECRKPFFAPAHMGRFDAPNSPCKAEFSNDLATNLDVAYAWAAYEMRNRGLNPIVNYQVTFSPVPRIPNADGTSRVEGRMAALCPGAEIRLARPVVKRRFRIRLELPAVRLQDLNLAERGTF